MLAAGVGSGSCLLHGSSTDAARVTRAEPARAPRGRAARVVAPSRPPGRAPTTGRAAAVRRARALAYGRRRAADRIAAPGYRPHPGWRHLIAPQWRVLVDQTEALRVVDDLIDAQDWRSDKRRAWSAILHQLVHAMDWGTGLIAATTARRLGDAGARAPRTVSRVIAWARDVGLVVVVEHAASAEFLGLDHGRTPTYALVTDTPPPTPSAQLTHPEADPETNPVDEHGDLPPSWVGRQPLTRRLDPATPVTTSWPAFGIPQSAEDRTAAACCLYQRIGLDPGGVSRAPLWRARALLRTWWDARACPAAIAWMIDHHPDRPDHHRGDALRGATDPLRVIGARLRPWRGRLAELPATLVGVPGDYQDAQVARLARLTPAQPQPTTPTPDLTARPGTARHAATAAVAEHLRRMREARLSRSANLTKYS